MTAFTVAARAARVRAALAMLAREASSAAVASTAFASSADGDLARFYDILTADLAPRENAVVVPFKRPR